jgi:phosphatidate cytidylyltransferase
MNNLVLRGLTGAVFVLLVIGSIWLGPIGAPAIVFSLFMILGLHEFFQLFKFHTVVQINWMVSILFPLLVFGLLTAVMSGGLPLPWIALVFPVAMLYMLTELWRKKQQPLVNIGVTMLSVFYLVAPFFMMIVLCLEKRYILTGMFILIWSNDTFAYLSGRLMGKTPLFPRISPNKTWEGTMGGIVLTIAAALLIALLMDPKHDYIFWMISAAIIAPCAIFGDLLQSLFKRSLNLKDSGKILPGHGGILDRFDAALFAAPFFYCFCLIYRYF